MRRIRDRFEASQFTMIGSNVVLQHPKVTALNRFG